MRTAVASEASGALDKRNALIGGAFWGFDGRSWNAEQGRYVNGGEAGSDGALYYPWDGEKPYSLDTAEHLDVTLRPILDRYMDTITTLYETTAPGDDPSLSPTRRPSDAAVNLPNMQTQWSSQAYGLVNVAGHGNGDGVWAQHWINDWNDNRAIDNPAEPDACAGGACWEISVLTTDN